MTCGKFVSKVEGRLDRVVQEELRELSRSHIKTLIDEGKILYKGKMVKAGQQVQIGDEIEYQIDEPQLMTVEAQKVDFEIVYEDDDILVINKPQGLVVHPCESTKEGTLVNGLLYRVKNLSGINGVLRPGIVHRLDKNTSGLMIVAKNDLAHKALAKAISEKVNFKRKYIALCEGHFKNQEGRIESYIARDKKDRKKMAVSDSGRYAITNYRVIESVGKYDLVEFSLETGRTHQIRVHSKMLNHPIVGDDVYGHGEKGLNGQLLHSYKLELVHPRDGRTMSFEAPLPKHFEEFLNKITR